ncbi:MAG: serine protease [Planctomycetia bacterium]|nr:serine protease [Planctomycetia bacterium]
MAPDARMFLTSVCRLTCGPEQGTAFFVLPTVVMTCRHCVLPALLGQSEITIHLNGESTVAHIIEPSIPIDLDAVLLQLSEDFESSTLLPLVASHLPSGMSWSTFGFPRIRGEHGMAIEGTVSRTLHSDDLPRDVELTCGGVDLPTNYGGFSGAPIAVRGTVRAMLQKRLDGGLGAISLAKLAAFLDDIGAPFRSSVAYEELPAPLAVELRDAVPNSRMLWLLEQAVEDCRDGYVLLGGSPGSGKTLVAASFEPLQQNSTLIGRYFAGGYRGSDLPPAYYREIATFASWLSNEASIRSQSAIAVTAATPTADLGSSIAKNLKALSESLKTGERGVLIIDGVDTATLTHSVDFLDFLPSAPPPGLVIVLITTNPLSLRETYDHLSIGRDVEMGRLPQYDCEWLILKRLRDKVLPSQAATIAERSEGHPLTLQYFVNEVAACPADHVEEAIARLERSAGPTAYYERVWNRLPANGTSRYLLATIAVARSSLKRDELTRCIPGEQQPALLDCFAAVAHLLRQESRHLQFYHESFRDFVLDKSLALHDSIHEQLYRYCEATPASTYSITNRLYHRLRSSAHRPTAAATCSQAWLDSAARACIRPELVLHDVEDLLNDRLDAGDLVESLRILLARSRLQYRYNDVFARFAAAFAKSAIELGREEQSLQFVIRDGYCACPLEDILSLMRAYVLSGQWNVAQDLYHDLRKRCFFAYEHGGASYTLLKTQMVAAFMLLGGGSTAERRKAIVEVRRLNALFKYNLKSGTMDEREKEHLRSAFCGAIGGESLWLNGYATPSGANPVELALLLHNADDIAEKEGVVETASIEGPLPPGVTLLRRQEIGKTLEKALAASSADGAEDIVIRALVKTDSSIELVGSLYSQRVRTTESLNIRLQNGVDANESAIHLVEEHAELAAYLEDHSILDALQFTVRHEWERRLFNAAKWVGRVNGKVHRQQHLEQLRPQSIIDEIATTFFGEFGFSFADRIRWQEAYHIPERIFPVVLSDLASVIARCEPESSTAFAKLILDRSGDQLGLYTEGYCRALRWAANSLAMVREGREAAADLYRALLSYTAQNVFPRYNRLQELLECSHHLARPEPSVCGAAFFDGRIKKLEFFR